MSCCGNTDNWGGWEIVAGREGPRIPDSYPSYSSSVLEIRAKSIMLPNYRTINNLPGNRGVERAC